MKSTECKLLVAENRVLVVVPLEDANIKWENVSPDFACAFEGYYNIAQQDLEQETDINYGLNCLSVLERIGNMINNVQVSKDYTFDMAWNEATEVMLQELEIA